MSDDSIPIGGWHAVGAALKGPRRVHEVLLRAGLDSTRARTLREAAQARGIAVRQVEQTELERLLPRVNHQGCAALVAPARALNESDLDELVTATDSPLLLVLDQVQDPHNLGAALRSAAAAGADAVIVPRDRSVGLTAAVRKVAAGGAEAVALVQVTNLARSLKRLQSAGIWLVGTDAGADMAIHAVDLSGPLALVLGGEQGGMRRLTRECCDTLASIPMAGGVESLNVSVAAGVCLFEAVRQRSG